MDILEEIVAHKVEELQERMAFIPPRRLCSLVEEKIKKETSVPVSMRQALMDPPASSLSLNANRRARVGSSKKVRARSSR